MNVFDVKVDKMTIVGNLKETHFIQRFIDLRMLEVSENSHDLVKGQIFPAHVYDESAYFTYDQRNAEAMRKRNFRIEFNPAKITDKQKEFIREKILCWCAPGSLSFSRLDLALDCNVNIGSYAFESEYAKSGAVFYAKNGSIEGLYVGKRESEIFIRAYDKKREQLREKRKELASNERNKLTSSEYTKEVQNGLEREIELLENVDNWWRLEFEVKGSARLDLLIENGFSILFDNLRIMDYDFSNVKGLEKAVLVGLLERPEIFEELSKNTKSKYKKMFRELGGVDLSKEFREELRKKEPLILADLRDWLKI